MIMEVYNSIALKRGKNSKYHITKGNIQKTRNLHQNIHDIFAS